MGVAKPSLILLFVQQDKRSLEESKSLDETEVFGIFGKSFITGSSRIQNLHQNPLSYTVLNLLRESNKTHDIDARRTR